MEIYGFTIKNKKEFPDGSKQFDLLHEGVLIAHVTVNDIDFDVALDFKTKRSDAASAGQRLLQHYPDGFDSSYRYSELGGVGLSSAAAYAGEYGNIVFLLEQLMRMDELENIFIKHGQNGEQSVVVYKTNTKAALSTHVIPNHRMQKFQHDVIIHNGVITFVGGKDTDFVIK